MPRKATKQALSVVDASSSLITTPFDFTDEERDLFHSICDQTELNVGMIEADLSIIEGFVRAQSRARAASEYARTARDSGDFKAWAAAEKVAESAYSSARNALRTLRLAPTERASRVGKSAQAQRLEQISQSWADKARAK